MTQQQWEQHKDHMDNHIEWPATKAEIVAACSGEDVEPGVLAEIKNKLPEGDRKYDEEELKNMLVVATM